ncbi:hypothetical protein [Haloarchaeobius sp. TZWSO28]|uniref:hypothetical protein n=1 Tax=Haloarchaeobius sp. TZWSO28 TaxID=3446119 RepID=UPI003EBD94EF
MSEQEIGRAEDATDRAELLQAVISEVRDRERAVIEADVDRLRLWFDGYDRLTRRHEVSEPTIEQCSKVERICGMMEQLIARGRHEKVRTNDRFSPGAVDRDLRVLDAELEQDLDADQYTDGCLSIIEDLLPTIHDGLASLDDPNPRQSAFANSLGEVKELLTEAENKREDDPAGAANTARIALEGVLIHHYSVSRAVANQHLAAALAELIDDQGLDLELDYEDSAQRGDVEALLTELTSIIRTEVSRSKGARLRRLIEEHDGSVGRTAAATEFTISEILETLQTMHNDGKIADVEVTFE